MAIKIEVTLRLLNRVFKIMLNINSPLLLLRGFLFICLFMLNTMKSIALIFLSLCFVFPSKGFATHLQPERVYQQQWCSNAQGVTEYRLPDRTRVDCLTATHAIEFDFAAKWAEAIGQSLYYGACTDKTPGIVLILERPSDERYLARLQRIAKQYGITLWTIQVYSVNP